MAKGLSTPTITVNNVVVAIIPETFTYTEGKGEATLRAASSGGGRVTTVFTRNVSTQISAPKFGLYNTNESLDLAREWANNDDENVITATDVNGFSRTFSGAAITNDYEPKLSSDGSIDLEFMSLPAV